LGSVGQCPGVRDDNRGGLSSPLHVALKSVIFQISDDAEPSYIYWSENALAIAVPERQAHCVNLRQQRNAPKSTLEAPRSEQHFRPMPVKQHARGETWSSCSVY